MSHQSFCAKRRKSAAEFFQDILPTGLACGPCQRQIADQIGKLTEFFYDGIRLLLDI
jgi:hypothetical protein